MNDIQSEQDVSKEAAKPVEVAQFSVGKVLQETRVRLGLSIGDVSHRIKLAPRQIESLEADDFAHLPETSFVRGFVRSYARLLQIDPVPLLAALPNAPEQFVTQEANTLTEVAFPDSNTERKQNIIWLAGALVVVLALALSAWMLSDKPKEQKLTESNLTAHPPTTVETLILPISGISDAKQDNTLPTVEKANVEKLNSVQPASESIKKTSEAINLTQAVSSPVKSIEIQPPKAITVQPPKTITIQPPKAIELQPNNTIEMPPVQKTDILGNSNNPAVNLPGSALLRMTFDADSWVEIKDKNGKTLLSRMQHAGGDQNIRGMPPFSMVIGNAKSVHLFYKGQVVDLLPHINIEVARLTLE